MVQGCILVKTVPTKVETILNEVRKMKEVEKAYIAFGRWDIVAFISVEDYRILKTLTSNINAIEGVRSTETLVES